MKTSCCICSLLTISLLSLSVFGQSFSDPQTVSLVSQPIDVSFADLDGDGDLDLLSGSLGDDLFFWQENLGGGLFGAQQIITAFADSPNKIEATDLDNDGDMDIVTAAYYDSRLAWHENLGGGTFGSAQTLDVTLSGTFTFHLVDLNQDGLTDIVAASVFSIAPLLNGYVGWFENLGGGSFGARQDINLDLDTPAGVNSGDFDGDGDIDVISADFNSVDGIFLSENLGSETFGPSQLISMDVANPYRPEVGDLDGDGDLDILSISFADSKVAWYANDGSGSFGAQQIISTAFSSPRDAALLDMDSDGDLDAVIGMYFDDRVVLFRNNGVGGFTTEILIDDGLSGVWSFAAADIDGDGDRDLAIGERLGDRIKWYINDEINACENAPIGLLSTLGSSPTGSTNAIDLGWSPVPAATSYRIGVRRISPAPQKKKLFNSTEATLTIDGVIFPAGDIYQWSVKAACISDTTDWATAATIVVPALASDPAHKRWEVAQVFPNPFEDVLYLNVGKGGSYKLVVTDLLGRKVLSQEAELTSSQLLTISTTDWSTGHYHYTLAYRESAAAAVGSPLIISGSLSKQ